MNDEFDLDRFISAQNPCLQSVYEELRRGLKQGHWIWFIFPQLKGLGQSGYSHWYGIGSRAEAEAYLAHGTLGPRLVECTELVNSLEGRSIDQIFGGIDSIKFRSSMTLFAEVSGDGSVFRQALQKYFGGEPDQLTLRGLDTM